MRSEQALIVISNFGRRVGVWLCLWMASGALGGPIAPRSSYADEAEHSADERFAVIADTWWQSALRRDPLLATYTGDHRFDDALPRVSVADSQAKAAEWRAFRQQLAQLESGRLSPANRINYAVLVRTLDDELAELTYRADLIPITNREGFHITFPELRHRMPLRTADDYRHYIARLAGLRDYAAAHIELMRAGIQAGQTLPAVVLERYREPIETHLVDDVTKSLFYEPLRAFPSTVPEAERAELIASAERAIRESIVPGYQDFLEFMRDEYVPAARGSIGASALPDGRAFYRHRVRHFTTLDLTPSEVHAIGQREVQRIEREMEQLAQRLGHRGDLRSFMTALRDDPRFHAASVDDLLKTAASILKQIDGKLPELFRVLPRTPYGLAAIPAYLAPSTSTAYYMPPSGDGSRAGFFYLNTYDLKSRPLYELESLSLHEAVPGHHLQIALQQELHDLPPYRRFAEFTAFVEGWGLYAEHLGLEMGFYQDPYNDFGRLTYEMWRACRLVVDSGIHDLGWTREQAVEFMVNHTALSLHNIRAEVDRYIAWPGQALGYKIGELKLLELRRRAEQHLGSHFDVREFHDVVLRNGALPLDVLEQQVNEWLAAQPARN